MASDRTSSNRPEELLALKAEFEEKCRIIDDVGDFKHVVTIKRNNSDLAYKFQIEGGYPKVTPHIVIKSTQLSDHDKSDLTRYLQNAAKTNSATISQLVKLADAWLKTQNLEYVFIEAEKSEKKTPKKKKPKPKKTAAEEVYEEKKCSMKTAEDVIKRIQWDSALPTEDFIVAYIDRFVGIVEKSFSAFSWEDIASVDYDELAIPQHRIQYFKYKKEIVWEKTKRIDNFFGSTGSKKTILDVIANYKEIEQPKPKQSALFGDDDDDDDSDEDVAIHTGFSNLDLTSQDKMDQKETATEEETSATGDAVDSNSFDGIRGREQYWGPKRRPTHFICLRITDPQIRDMVKNVHGIIQALEPEFAESFIPVQRLHITLACVGLDTVEEVNKASRALLDLQETLQEMDPQKMEVELDGIGNFFDNVLYAKVKKNESFMEFVALLHSLIIGAGIEIRDVFEFQPHITLLKFKRAVLKEKRTRFMLDSRVYNAVENPYFGKQAVSNIHLCVMTETCGANGFYITPAKITFSDKDGAVAE